MKKLLALVIASWCAVDFYLFITYPQRLSEHPSFTSYCKYLEARRGGNGSMYFPPPGYLPASRAEPFNINSSYWGGKACHQLNLIYRPKQTAWPQPV